MKSTLVIALVALLLAVTGTDSLAQYKAPSQYFRKDSPRNPGTPGSPAAPGAPATPGKPAAPVAPKFKDLPVNSQFFFVSDTNRAYAWTKISADSAKNTKNGVTQAINAETPIQR